MKGWSDALEQKWEVSVSPLSVLSIDLAADGSYGVTSAMDAHLKLWRIAENTTLLNDVDVPPMEMWTLRLAPRALEDSANGTPLDRLAVTSHSGTVSIWHLTRSADANSAPALQKKQTLETSSGKFVLCVDWTMSQTRDLLAVGAADGVLTVFNAQTTQRLYTLEAHMMPIRAVAFSSDSRTLLTASDDMHINVYDVETGKPIQMLSGHASWVLSVAWNPQRPGLFASASSDKKVKIWDVGAAECVCTLAKHDDQVWGLAWNERGTQLVSVSDDRSIVLYNALAEK
jgi:WD repeat-containing protein 61